MSGPLHHPDAETLAAYAAGALEPGFGLVVGVHLEGCAACRQRVAAYEAHSGAALDALPDAPLGADALHATLSRLDDAPAPTPQPTSILQRLPLKPRKWLAPGVWVAAVDTPHAPDNRVYVLSVAPGMPTARHQHSGAEFCTVLSGAFRDDQGEFGPGDFAAADGDYEHQPIVVGDEPCLCLFATEGRLKPRGLIGRMVFRYADV